MDFNSINKVSKIPRKSALAKLIELGLAKTIMSRDSSDIWRKDSRIIRLILFLLTALEATLRPIINPRRLLFRSFRLPKTRKALLETRKRVSWNTLLNSLLCSKRAHLGRLKADTALVKRKGLFALLPDGVSEPVGQL